MLAFGRILDDIDDIADIDNRRPAALLLRPMNRVPPRRLKAERRQEPQVVTETTAVVE